MEINDLLKSSPQDFIAFLKEKGIKRFYFVYDHVKKKMLASHSLLQPIADFIKQDKRDFYAHEGLFFQISDAYDTLLGAFIHRTNRGQAAGGVRYWYYDSMEDYLRDGLRLAKGMTRKNALAGLWWGGGKGVMAYNPLNDKHDESIRQSIYREYGRFMTSLRGCYVTAEDVGTNVDDMAQIFSETRFTTCIPHKFGGSGNPSIPTAKGVISGMEAASDFIGDGTLEGKTIAVQGLGNVGLPLISFLFEKNVKRVIASDISEDRISKAKETFKDENFETKLVKRGDNSIAAEECDIFSPCATGGILNPDVIPTIKANIVCGAANNQLEDSERDDYLLYDKGIVYVPDFLTNRMGIVNCANEHAGYVNNDPFIERHYSYDWQHSIYRTTIAVLTESRDQKEPPNRAAISIADKLSMDVHPIFGHRGRQIIESLVADGWEKDR